ncbi:CoA transferase [Actinospica durhamensis]|uniref:CoA transferase n=1 Tax=Actinospica durhamensis TaxID=1508375 RepID=A0A941ET06_9ACTN|nr:CaiB/BaiF CoA-transferase family protein [Actinospica durhamensis]MBR7837830.1 CoA transferase [Actinospica durhamensis]
MPPLPSTGPLVGLRVLELASLAPAPFACTVISDLGAEVLRIDRPDTVPARLAANASAAAAVAESATSTPVAPSAQSAPMTPMAQGGPTAPPPSSPHLPPPPDPLGRGRRSVAVDLRHPRGVETVLRLVEQADVLVEGFRPGVCERLGIGPEVCAARNPRLIYARMTGYGQDGPLSARAGHDINYLSIAGALEPLGPADGPPLPPLNYVADFGGGGMLLVVGVLSALWERTRSGRGQVVDASMVEGSALITSILHGLHASGLWETQRGSNLFDGSAPFYGSYECADGRYVAVGALEPKFWSLLLTGLGLADQPDLPAQHDRARWPELRARIADVFRTRTRDEWAAHFADSDACVTPVLSPFEAHLHPHNAARGTFAEVGGLVQPAPAPRFSRTPGRIASPAPHPGEHAAALADWGIEEKEIRALRDEGVVV